MLDGADSISHTLTGSEAIKRPSFVSYGTMDYVLRSPPIASTSQEPDMLHSRSPSRTGLKSYTLEASVTLDAQDSVSVPLFSDAKLYRRPTTRERLFTLFSYTLSVFVSSFFLVLVVLWALIASLPVIVSGLIKRAEDKVYEWDDPDRWKNEQFVKEVQYYASAAGYGIIDEEVETEDGYFLRLHRVVSPRQKRHPDAQRQGYPVLILHGLFQSSGAFVTSEERSLAFWLAEQGGYQVFLGNTRGVFNMGHRELSRSDPQFWDWTVRDLAMYDLPAMVEYVCKVTGYEKLAYIGHSQGTTIAFLSLSTTLRPELGNKISAFLALAPAVYAGPLTRTRGFPFTVLGRLGWGTWRWIFGTHDFIPLMRYAYDWVPPRPFAAFGYIMFAYLFSWTDANWLKRRKIKIFRFTPAPVSSATIFWWCGKDGFVHRRTIFDHVLPQWFDQRFPPLAIYYGGKDYLVDAEKLVERLKKKEKDVRIIRVVRIEDAEHCDFYLAANAVEWCFHSILEDIERTRTDRDTNPPTTAPPTPSIKSFTDTVP